MQFYTLMKDYGRDGREAICDPEETRAGIVAEVRDILIRGTCEIAFIWDVREGQPPRDITQEIISEARADIEAQPIDRQALRFDAAHDHRKNWVA